MGIAVARGGFTTGRILGKLGDGKSGGGGTVINNYFPNYVGDKADLMSAVRSELGKLQNRQGRSGLR